MAARVREEPERKVYALRHAGPYSTIIRSFRSVGAHVGRRGQRAVCVIGVFCDDPREVPPEKLESYACMEVRGRVTPDGEIEARTLPRGLVASALARGPYGGEAVMEAYSSIFAMLRTSRDYEALGLGSRVSFEHAFREIYLDPPPEGSGEDPSTEVVLPIRRK